jgi:HK97 family phage prohead protease
MNRLLLETKALAVSDEGELSGIAWAWSPDRRGDIIERKAFAGIAGPVVMLWQHRPDEPIGVWDAITPTDAGLEVKGRLFVEESPRAREARAMVREGVVKGLSLGFRSIRKADRPGFPNARIFSAVSVEEISLVTRPAHPAAQVMHAKSQAEAAGLAALILEARAALRI